MREIASSMIGYVFAQGLYAGQEVAKIAGAPSEFVNPKNPPAPGPKGEKPRSFSGFLYTKTKETLERFGDPAAVLFIAGDEYQTKAVDFMFDLFSGASAMNLHYWSKFGNRLLTQGQIAADAAAGARELYAQQAKNTRYIFTLVRNNPEKLGVPQTGPVDLSIYMPKAYGIGQFENIWSVEGLGHVYSQRVWKEKWDLSEEAHDILIAADIPEKALTMMHAGLGLNFAESLMKQLTPASSSAEVKRVLSTFIKLCKNNSRPGYAGCAIESLGLVTRCFNFSMVSLVQSVLADLDETAWEFFYRGAGRALYFSPGHMMQPLYSPWIAADDEAPNERAHNILKAGIMWPTNIVNMQNPEIVEDLIRRRGADYASTAAIVHGVAASTAMAMDITPNHPVVAEYLKYVPKSSDPKVIDLWKKLVHDPAHKAVHKYQPILKAHGMMDQLFRFQDLDALVAKLEPAAAAGSEAQQMHA